jgi:hypothetical protein
MERLEAVALTAILVVLVLLGKDLLVAVVLMSAQVAAVVVLLKQATLTEMVMVVMGYKVV